MHGLKNAVSYLLVFTLSVYPFHSIIADSLSDVGRSAQDDGTAFIEEYKDSPPEFDAATGTISIPSTGHTVNISDLFPGTSASSDHSMDTFFPDGFVPDVGSLEGISTDPGDLETTGRDFQSGLYTDAMSPNPSTTGAAYKVLIDRAAMSRPNLTNDPALTTSRNIYSNIEAISATFGDCETTTSYSDITHPGHIPDYKICERVLDKTQDCMATHIVSAHNEVHVLPVDVNVTTWDTSGNNEHCTLSLRNPANGQSTSVDAHFDETGDAENPLGLEENTVSNCASVIQHYISNNTFGYNDNLINIGIDLTGSISLSGAIANSLSLPGWSQVYASMTIGVVDEDYWTPESCTDSIDGLVDGFASGELTCLSQATETNGCSTYNGVRLCQDDLLPSPYPTVPKMCESLRVNVDYDFKTGTYCYLDGNGVEQCVDGDIGSDNTCEVYEQDPGCGFISTGCVKGAQALDGTCYVVEEKWDCGETVLISDVQTNQNIECSGPIRCMGDDCMDIDRSQSASFASTAALLNAAQFMSQDMNCMEGDATGASCQVFSGVSNECKVAIGGIQDCCDVPTNTTTGTYINALFQMARLDSSLVGLEDGNVVKGAYQTLREPIANTVSTVTRPFVSHVENISGSITEFSTSVDVFVEGVKTEIKEALTATINDMLGQTATDIGVDAATGSLASETTAGAADTAGSTVVQGAGAIASAVMIAYTAYVVAVMVIQVLYSCEEEEFSLAAKKDTNSCSYVGSYCADEVLGVCVEKRESYCCFNSPLSRIINEQVRPQLGRPFGDPENPDCSGMAMSEVETIDWSMINLEEWTALLTKFNLMPNPELMDLNTMTGSGSGLNVIGGGRIDAGGRAAERLDGLDVDVLRKEAEENTAIDPTGG